MKEVFTTFFFCISIAILWTSCFDDNVVESNAISIETSLDTLRFDTVFTSVGSATRSFKIYNRSNEDVELKRVYLGESNSKFRINVDGIANPAVQNIFIKAGDSIYVFVEVTVDPDDPLSVSPFIISEELIIESHVGTDKLTLEAWGQNANYYPSKDAQGRLIRLTCDNQSIVWDDPKPYVVYGLLFVDSCGLVIPPSAKVYFHGGLGIIDNQIYNDGGLIIMQDGHLQILGDLEDRVILQGDRLELGFGDISGQWAGIRLLPGSRGNRIENATIKNSVVGIRVDSAAELHLHNSIIANTSNVGLIGLGAEIQLSNTLIHSNGGQSAILASGGDYRLEHVTMANYENQAPALYIDNYECLDVDCDIIEVRPVHLDMTNCIIMGSNEDELNMTDITEGDDPGSFQVNMRNTVLRLDKLKNTFDLSSFCTDCLEITNEPMFVDVNNDDYQLDSLSDARSKGIYLEHLPFDLNGRIRDNRTPDLGCFEAEK